MSPILKVLLPGFGLLIAVTACRIDVPLQAAAAPSEPAATAPDYKVQDLAAFEAFIGGRPTAEAFRNRYPGVKLVLPGEIATRELRMDRSRYFADLDEQQRIRGGRFQ